MFRQALIGAALAFAASATVVHAQTVAPATPIASPAAVAGPDTDPYLWLEDVASPRSTAWVAAENAKTLGVLQSDPHYPALEADALAIAQAKDRIPSPEIINGRIYNFWQDADHVRGIWRWTTPQGHVDRGERLASRSPRAIASDNSRNFCSFSSLAKSSARRRA